HGLEQRDRVAPEVVGGAAGDVVEVPGGVDGDERVLRPLLLLEEVELDLRVGVAGEARVGGLLQGALEDVARVGAGGLTGRGEDVAEHAGDAVLLAAPGQQLEGRRVRLGEHVRLVHAGEALDGAAVEADPLGERRLDLGSGDGQRLEHAERVGEPQPDEADVALLDRPEDVLLLPVHRAPSLAVPHVRARPRRCSLTLSRREYSSSPLRPCTGPGREHRALPVGRAARGRRPLGRRPPAPQWWIFGSHRGPVWARSPSSPSSAGSMIPRTTVASRSTATAIPTPSCFISSIDSVAKIENTPTMTAAALVTTPAERASPARIAVRGSMPWSRASRTRLVTKMW